MRTYEELFIVKPDAPEEETDAYISQIKDLIAGSGGKVEKEEKWGVRKLAYRVMKYTEGAYVLLVFQASPAVVSEIERRMRVSDLVIKYLTVRVDQRARKIEKRRKHREKRAARKPPPPAAPPAVPAEPGPPTPGAPAAVAVEQPVEGTGE
jgi:small subunit ribosomal protein S6